MTILAGFLLILFVTVVYCEPVNTNRFIQVTTPTGDMVGFWDNYQLGGIGYTVYKFRGIPYGEAPINNFRFKKPVPKSYFNSPYDATKDGSICYQAREPKDSNHIQSEDCLRLNIYVPSSPQKQPKPVMVWFHGGGFMNGESYSYNASMLSAIGGVVVVTVNYRLAHLGFFTTGDSAASGNYGLWDQHLALRWISRNIEAFTGDPSKVTIFGGSAGASSVLYQAFYPGNKGLFQRIIAQSGTTISPWAYKGYDHNKEVSRKFVEAAGCKQENPVDQTACLQALPVEILNSTMKNMTSGAPGPVLDYEFILDEPENLLSGKTYATAALEMFNSVDLMIGYNSADGMIDFLLWLYATNTRDLNRSNFRLPQDIYALELVPYYISRYFNKSVTEIERLVTLYEYTDWSSPYDEGKRIMELVKLATDCHVGVSTVKTAVRHSMYKDSGRTTYAYEFAVQPLQQKYPILSVLDRQDVMNHGDEVSFVFGMGVETVSNDLYQISKFHVYLAAMKMWANFAYSGYVETSFD